MNNLSPTNEQHRRRLLDSLGHRESDRIPLTLGSPSCSLHKIALENLMRHLHIEQCGPALITDQILQIAETDDRILDFFDVDLRWLLPNEAPVQWNDTGHGYVDEFSRKFIAGGGFYNQIDYPLKHHSVAELSRFKFPELTLHHRFDHLPTRAESLYAAGYGLGIDGPWGIYEISSSLVGAEQYLMDLVIDSHFAQKVAEVVLEKYHLPFYDLLLSKTGSYVQIVGISDDLGGQENLLFSPKIFRQIFKPLLRELIIHIRARTNAKIYMHSDGSIFPILQDLIEIGVDGLNPVQYTAKGMELTRLKKEFGKDLGFFGGVVDNATLSFTSPSEVRKVVKGNVEILKKGGGFIFAPIHNISQEVPPENIVALYQAGIEFGRF